ncbi:MAG: phosphoribosylformimino-5-aminoimidazole carboxamide ribotide isomerase [Verrucomicrobiales bacterium]
MTRFRPCIDLHGGQVKQIVGGTLGSAGGVQTNFVSDRPPGWFADLYRQGGAEGGHVIMLGPGNGAAAREALAAWPGGLQVGGGIGARNAETWLEAGASHVIVTSWLFSPGGEFLPDRLAEIARAAGADRLVIDLSCRAAPGGGWVVAMDKWQTPTSLRIGEQALDDLAASCTEFLIHAADVEGKCGGIDEALVETLGGWGSRTGHPITYAGGARSIADLELVDRLSGGSVDVTIGSALDIFGGSGVRFEDCLAFNRRAERPA